MLSVMTQKHLQGFLNAFPNPLHNSFYNWRLTNVSEIGNPSRTAGFVGGRPKRNSIFYAIAEPLLAEDILYQGHTSLNLRQLFHSILSGPLIFCKKAMASCSIRGIDFVSFKNKPLVAVQHRGQFAGQYQKAIKKKLFRAPKLFYFVRGFLRTRLYFLPHCT